MTRVRKSAAQKQQDRYRAITRTLAFSLLAVMIAGIGAWQFQQWLENPATLPVKVVRIDGDIRYLQKAELERAVADEVSGGYFNIDLKAIRQQAHTLAWVDDASVRRLWPDTIVMTIRERVAVARWGDDRLISTDGDIFKPSERIPEGLPLLRGMPERAADVLQRYQREAKRFQALGLTVSEVQLNRRGAWSVRLAGGAHIHVGRINVEKRLARLVNNYAALTRQGEPQSIDLRYRHGIAVSWVDTDEAQQQDSIEQGAAG